MNCHLDYYFFFLGGLQLIGVIVYAIVTAKIKIGRAKPYNQNSFARSVENSRSSHERSYGAINHPGENVIFDPHLRPGRLRSEIS